MIGCSYFPTKNESYKWEFSRRFASVGLRSAKYLAGAIFSYVGGDFFPYEFHKISAEYIYKKNRKRTHMNIFIFLKSKIEKWNLEPRTSADGTPGPRSGSSKFISWTRDPKHSKRDPGPSPETQYPKIFKRDLAPLIFYSFYRLFYTLYFTLCLLYFTLSLHLVTKICINLSIRLRWLARLK